MGEAGEKLLPFPNGGRLRKGDTVSFGAQLSAQETQLISFPPK